MVVVVGFYHNIEDNASQQKRVASSDQCKRHTEHAAKQKEERDIREEEFAKQGMIVADVEVAKGRKKFKQEDHKDDSGSELAPLGEVPMQTVFAADGVEGSAVACSFFGSRVCCSGCADVPVEGLEEILGDNLGLHYFSGSDGHARHTCPRSVEIPVAELCSYLARPGLAGKVNVVEVFGGAPGVGQLCVRRRLVRGGGGSIWLHGLMLQ